MVEEGQRRGTFGMELGFAHISVTVDFIYTFVYKVNMKRSDAYIDLQALASSQWGMFTSAQAVRLGIARVQLRRMADDGRLERMGGGVYRYAAGEVTANADVKAAWLATEPARPAYDRVRGTRVSAVCAGATALWLHGVGDLDAVPYTFRVPVGKRTARPNVRYLAWGWDEGDLTVADGLPVTCVERTVADLVRLHADRSHLADALRDARATREVDLGRLAGMLAPLASRCGYARGDGEALVDELVASGR